jgi:hypothetical protein
MFVLWLIAILRGSAVIAAPTQPVSTQTSEDSIVRVIFVDQIAIPLDSNATLQNVESMLGETKIRSSGGHDGYDWICYRVIKAKEVLYLAFGSDYMGGVDRDVMIFSLGHSPPSGIARALCTSPIHADRIGTNNSLSLGMTTDSLIDIMGTPKSHVGNSLTFEYYRAVIVQGRKKFEFGSELDYSATLDVELRSGRIWQMSASYLASQ